MKTRQKLLRFFSIIFTLLIFSTVVINAVPPQVEAANEGSFVSTTLLNQVKDKNKYMWLRACFDDKNIDTVTEDEVNSWDFFQDDRTDQYEIIGNIYGPGNDATRLCEEEDNVKVAFEALGITDSKRLFCSLAGSYMHDNDDGPNDSERRGDECYSHEVGDGDNWNNDENDNDKVRESFQNIIKNGHDEIPGANSKSWVTGGLNDEQEYIRYYVSFMEQCGVGDSDVEITGTYQEGDADDDDKYKLPVVNSSGNISYMLASGQVSNGSQVAIYAQASSDATEYKDGDGKNTDGYYDVWPRGEVPSCNDAVEKIRKYAPAYSKWLIDHPEEQTKGEVDTDNGDDGGDDSPSCWSNSGPLAWLLCPVLDLLDGAINLLDTWVNNLLFIDSETGYASEGVSSGNAVMRNIALLLLVPMMMFMVIGTALNFGPFDPYTVKKALPRMMVATIFIVLSLPICQFAVEVSNTVGQGAGNLILSATNSDIDSLSAIFGSHGDSGGFAGLFLEGGAATIGVFTLTWGVVGSFALVTIVALLIGFVILVMRQVLVMMLIVLAPLAIIVWIFPGNDKLWGIWKGTFQAMLLLYPIVAVLIASGRFVASVVGGG